MRRAARVENGLEWGRRSPHHGRTSGPARYHFLRWRRCPSGPRERPAKPYSRGFKSRPALVSTGVAVRQPPSPFSGVRSGGTLLAFSTLGPLAQLVRAPARHAGGHKFDSCTAHSITTGPRVGRRGFRPVSSGYRADRGRRTARDLRSSIDNIDAALILLLAERFKVTKAVGEYKAAAGLPPADPDREGPDRPTPAARRRGQPRSRLQRELPSVCDRRGDPSPRAGWRHGVLSPSTSTSSMRWMSSRRCVSRQPAGVCS